LPVINAGKSGIAPVLGTNLKTLYNKLMKISQRFFSLSCFSRLFSSDGMTIRAQRGIEQQ